MTMQSTTVEYHFHWSTGVGHDTPEATVKVSAESDRHGAALALRTFRSRGCDIFAPLAHLDLTDANGVHRILLVDEVVAWLGLPTQVAFVEREGLSTLLA